MTHICVNKLTSIGSDNGLSPGRRQAIIWTNVGILLLRTLGTIISEILTEIDIFAFTKNTFENVVWEMAAILYRPQCFNVFPVSIGTDIKWNIDRILIAWLHIPWHQNRSCFLFIYYQNSQFSIIAWYVICKHNMESLNCISYSRKINDIQAAKKYAELYGLL